VFTVELFKWDGANFSKFYEWLTRQSFNKNFKLKIETPGQPNSAITIDIDNNILRLNVDDTIIRGKDGSYSVIKK